MQPVTNAKELSGRSFVAVALSDGGKSHAVVDGTKIVVSFRRERDGYVVGAEAGCNSMGGWITSLADGRLVVRDFASTAMGCPAGLAEQDEWISGLLTERPLVEASADELVITGATKRAEFTERDTG